MALQAYAFINFCLYPALMRYQAGSEAAKYLKGTDQPEELKKEVAEPGAEVVMLKEASIDYSFEFYCPVPVRWIAIDSLSGVLRQREASRKGQRAMLLFLPASFGDSLARRGYSVQELKRFPNFHISQLTGEFLNYRTREATLEEFSLYVQRGSP